MRVCEGLSEELCLTDKSSLKYEKRRERVASPGTFAVTFSQGGLIRVLYKCADPFHSTWGRSVTPQICISRCRWSQHSGTACCPLTFDETLDDKTEMRKRWMEGRKKHRSAGWQERGKVPFLSNWSQRITSSASAGLDSRQNVTFFSVYPSFCLSQGSEVYRRIFVWELAVCTGSLTEVCKCGSDWEGRNTDLWIIERGLTTADRSCDTHVCPCFSSRLFP